MTVDPPGPTALVGILNDTEIRAEVDRGQLISDNFREPGIVQSCYELRVGPDYLDLSVDEPQLYRIGTDAPDVLIKPFQRVVVMTEELLQIPPDVVGRILLKGRLFSLGLIPINTYADPGFSGRLGVVLYNASPRHIRLTPGQPIAKIEFERLPAPVTKPYRGQHGYGTEVWPLLRQMYVSDDDLKRDPRVQPPATELSRAFGKDFGAMYERLFGYGRILLLSVLAYIGIAVLVIVVAQRSGDRLPTFVSVVLGLVTNIVSSLLIYFATTPRARFGRRR